MQVANPELYGMGAIVIALITAWTKMRPAMKKIESEQDHSLRTDLLERIKHLEQTKDEVRREHDENLKALRSEYEGIIDRMQARYDRVCAEYEQKLANSQVKIDMLTDALLKRRYEGKGRNRGQSTHTRNQDGS